MAAMREEDDGVKKKSKERKKHDSSGILECGKDFGTGKNPEKDNKVQDGRSVDLEDKQKNNRKKKRGEKSKIGDDGGASKVSETSKENIDAESNDKPWMDQQIRKEENIHVEEIKIMKDKKNNTFSDAGGIIASDFRTGKEGEKQAREEGHVKKNEKKTNELEGREVDCVGKNTSACLHQIVNDVVEKVEPMKVKKKKSKANHDFQSVYLKNEPSIKNHFHSSSCGEDTVGTGNKSTKERSVTEEGTNVCSSENIERHGPVEAHFVKSQIDTVAVEKRMNKKKDALGVGSLCKESVNGTHVLSASDEENFEGGGSRRKDKSYGSNNKLNSNTGVLETRALGCAGFVEDQLENVAVEKVKSMEVKKKKKTKKDDLGACCLDKEFVNNGEKTRYGGSKNQEKYVGSSAEEAVNATTSGTKHANEVIELSDGSVSGKKKKKVTFSGKDEYFFLHDNSSKGKQKFEHHGASGTNHVNEGVEPSDRSVSCKKKRKVTFSGQGEYFSLPDSSSKGKKKLEEDGKESKSFDEGLVQGKRFTEEEDELVEKALLDYIKDHQLGENGLEMVLNCRLYPEIKGCWKEIAQTLPHRPHESVYHRAHILFQRSKSRKWTEEELELVKKSHEKHGANWKTLADELGKHRFHVKDAWRRIKLPNRKKGHWSQDEYQALFDLVNIDLSLKALQEKKLKHGMLRDNISWEAISEKLSTRTNAVCCTKWYKQLSSPMVSKGKWADTDDYRLLMALSDLDATCEEDVNWDNLLELRPGDVCRNRWNQMVRHIGHHGIKPFGEQIEILSQRYCPEILEAREAYESKPAID